MPSVLVTEPIIEEAISKLEQEVDVTIGERGYYSDEQNLIGDIANFDALLSMLSTPVTPDVLKAGKNLKIVANFAVGYDNIAVASAQEHGIRIANTPGVLTHATADTAFALLLSVARNLKASERELRAGNFDGWHPLGFLGTELNGKTMGIIGMGNIGSAVAARARGFGMQIVYHNRNRVDEKLENRLDARYISSAEKLIHAADIISLNCPLNDSTHHLIDEAMLAEMSEDTILINTARGAVIDEAALAEALHNGDISGAGLDVFEHEPEIHPDLLTAPHAVLTPHIGSGTHEARKKMGFLAVDAILETLEGKSHEDIPNLVL